jgi:8-oxo-dGTP pyrophosphatase MutT (NUDIX family)
LDAHNLSRLPDDPSPIPRPPGARRGRPPVWYRLPAVRRSGIAVDEVKRALAARPKERQGTTGTSLVELPPSRRTGPAAVLCLLFDLDDEANVVLTRRSRQLREHRGQVAFPGGRLLPGEEPLEAALREAQEEIRLDPAAVEVFGQLTPLTTAGQTALVNCFVGATAWPTALVATADEVARVFWVPLAELASDGVYHEELWPYGGSGQVARPSKEGELGSYHAVPFFNVAGEVVWGATGRLLAELLDVVLRARVG